MVRKLCTAKMPSTLAVWAAVLCLVFASMAPTVSEAIQASQASPMQFICSSVGPTTSDPSSQSDGSAMQAAHCPFCLQPTDRGAPPPQPLPYHFLVQGGLQAPKVWQAFFYFNVTPWAQQARAPPKEL